MTFCRRKKEKFNTGFEKYFDAALCSCGCLYLVKRQKASIIKNNS